MKLNSNVYLTSDNWFQPATRVAAQYQTLYPVKIPIYHHDSLGGNYGSFWEQQKYNFAPYNTPIDDSICYAGNMASSPVNDIYYLRLSDMPAEVNVMQLGFTDGTKNGVSFSHTTDSITLDGTLSTSSNTILIFDLKTDATTSTEFPANPFSGRPGTYTISPTGNSSIRLQLYGFNNGGGIQPIFNGSNGGTVTIDNSYDFYVFRLWIAGGASFTNHTFTCKCTLVQQRSVQKYSANTGADGGLFYALGASTFLGGANHDGLANRNCYYSDTGYTTQSRTNGYSCPITQIRYNDVVYLIYVECASMATGITIYRYTLSEYKNTYQSRYPYVRAFYMVPYIGNPDEGINRVPFEGTVELSELISGVSGSIALTSTNGLKVPDNINVDNVANDTFYHYGGSSITMGHGTYFGIPYQTYRPKQGGNDFSDCASFEACCPCRVTDDFLFDVEGNYCYAHFVGDLQRIIDICAWYGVPFTESATTAQTASVTNPTDEKLHIPVISNGYITGEYMSGTGAAELPNTSWGDDFREQNEFDGGPAEPFNMETELYPQNSAAASPFTYQYVFNATKLLNLKNYLYSTVAAATDETQLFEKFLTNNPIDCIASLTVFPFNVENYIDGVPGEHVVMGNVDTSIIATGIYRGMVIVLDGGSVKYRDYFGDFRSYEPYSDAELHIPYHGSVHITPSEYVGHTIGVKYLVDICSGASIALVFRDGLVIDSIAGQIGGTLRLTGIQTASYHNAVYSAASGYKQAKTSQAVQGASAVLNVLGAAGNAVAQKDIGGVLSAITSGIGGAAQNAINVENAEYNLNHVQIPFKTIGANTTFTSMGNEQYCRLIIKRPVMLDKYRAEDYGASVGFACCETGILGDYTGLTVCAGADLSGIPCTAAERAEILQFLKGGVRL